MVEGGIREEPLSRLEGHTHCVSSATWPSGDVIFTGGWDHSVGGGGGKAQPVGGGAVES